jgi:2-polyprenyl-3-methyl-5-hydroxy-6-metoxy-1,4-benzoquinol methylase
MDKRIWDFWAPRYHRLWVQRFSLAPTRHRVIAHLSSLPKNSKVLDVGCGTGQLFQDLQAAGFYGRYLGVDASQAMIEVATRHNPEGSFRVGAMEMLYERIGFWDAVVCLHALPYSDNPEEALRQMVVALKPGGLLLVASAASLTWYDRLVLRIVKLTTSPAVYPSLIQMNAYTQGRSLVDPACEMITKRPLPSLCLWRWQKKSDA